MVTIYQELDLVETLRVYESIFLGHELRRGPPIWHLIHSFPPNDQAEVERGCDQFAERRDPIIDVLAAEGVRLALEVHPTEIAYDFVTTEQTLAAIGRREGFGINLDPSHLEHQFLDPAAYADAFADRIRHVHVKDSLRRLDGRRSILASHLNFGDPRPGRDSSPRPRRRRLRRAVPRPEPAATAGRCRSSGRTVGWAASGAPARRSTSCAGRTSRRPRSRSTPPARETAPPDARRRRATGRRPRPGPGRASGDATTAGRSAGRGIPARRLGTVSDG